MTILLQGAGLQVTASAPANPLLLDLEADTLVLSDGDPVSTWADQSDNGYDFTQTGTARPTYHTGGGVPYVEFDGVNDSLIGPDFADNLSSFTVFIVARNAFSGEAISKVVSGDNPADGAGWAVGAGALSFCFFRQDVDNYIERDTKYASNVWSPPPAMIYVAEKIGSTVNQYYPRDFDNVASDWVINAGAVSSYSNTEPVRLAATGDGFVFGFELHAIRIYSPAPDATDRAAIEAELAARYGITL